MKQRKLSCWQAGPMRNANQLASGFKQDVAPDWHKSLTFTDTQANKRVCSSDKQQPSCPSPQDLEAATQPYQAHVHQHNMLCRFGAGELHCVAAIMGGIAAQEAIKLLTKQFVPLSGLLLYNAMASTSSVLRL